MEQEYLDDFDDDLQDESEKIRDAESIMGTSSRKKERKVIKKELPRTRAVVLDVASSSRGKEKESRKNEPPAVKSEPVRPLPPPPPLVAEQMTVKKVEVATASSKETASEQDNLWESVSTWKVVTVILALVVVLSVFTSGFRFDTLPTASSGAVIPLTEAESKVVQFLNENVLVSPFTATVTKSQEENGLYKLTLSIAGQSVDSYLSKDGVLLFPRWIDLTAPQERPIGPQIVQRFDIGIDNDPLLGETTAPVTIIEFANVKCSDCFRFHQDIFPKLKEQYIDTGKVRLVFRDYPTVESEFVGLAGECALEQGNQHFWTFHDRMFANLDQLTAETFRGWAQELNFNMERFDSCMQNSKYQKEFYEDLRDLKAAVGETPVPTFFINGQVVVGVPSFEEFARIIEGELEVTGGAPANAGGQPVKITRDQATVSEPIQNAAGEPFISSGEEDESQSAPAEEEEGTNEVFSVPSGSSSSSLRVEAKRWRFVPTEFRVRQGEAVQLTIVSQDLAFTFAIPDFGVSQTITAGGQETVTFTPTQTGTFAFTCSDCEEFRGMTGTIVVE